MKNQGSKKHSDLQLNQYIKAKFRCYFNMSFNTHEIRLLCYPQIKVHCTEIVQPNFEVLTPKGYLVSFHIEYHMRQNIQERTK